jgi:hypothetical protein
MGCPVAVNAFYCSCGTRSENRPGGGLHFPILLDRVPYRRLSCRFFSASQGLISLFTNFFLLPGLPVAAGAANSHFAGALQRYRQ